MKITIKNINVLRNSTWMVWTENIVLLFIIPLTFYITLDIETHYPREKKVSIPHNSTSKSIISQLNKSGYNIGFIDRYLLSFIGKITNKPINQGDVYLHKPLISRLDFLYKLRQAKIPPKKAKLFKITLIPGETKEIFLKQIEKKLDINATKLLQAYNKYAKYQEASISADTYLVPKKMDEEKLIKFLLKNSENTYEKLATKAYDEYNQTQWNRILTIASIIQKEAANKQEMPLVASVIYNRLKKNMRLQMDGTLNYGKYSHIKVTPKRIKTDQTRFNTYKHKGLPPSPIGAVGTAAIKAAILPAKTNYLYFMRNKAGVHDFTTSYKKHRKNIRKVK